VTVRRRTFLATASLVLVTCVRPDPQEREYIAALWRDRAAKDQFMGSPESPLPPERRSGFQGLRYFAPDPTWRVHARVESMAKPDTVRFLTSQRTFDVFLRIGRAHFTRRGREGALWVYRSLADEQLFVPFTDATSGRDTYGAGRYLDPGAANGDSLTLDFNRAYNPYCAYDARWVCPLPPPENHLQERVEAGEKASDRPH
jgi:uncharacterized protein (DUF1684 family)